MPSAPAAPDDDDAAMDVDVVAAEGGDGERFAVQAQDVLQPLCARLAAVPAGRRAPLVSMAMQVPLPPHMLSSFLSRPLSGPYLGPYLALCLHGDAGAPPPRPAISHHALRP